MTQEDRQLLLQDLSARLFYGVKVLDNSHKNYGMSKLINIGVDGSILIDNEINDIQYYPIIDEVKPYLRSLSDLTEEEKNEFDDLWEQEWGEALDSADIDYSEHSEYSENAERLVIKASYKVIEWLCVHHIDYRGLIEKGLAIRVTPENNPYKE